MAGSKPTQNAEAIFTRLRSLELSADPVEGSFDAAHLREVNRRIFQDLPEAGYTLYTPGEYRPPPLENGDWRKRRVMEGLPPSTVAYSRMDEDALARLDRALERADPEKLTQLDKAQFAQEISEIYAQLDYVHPFPDGNSRTLRAFTKQLANESGYDIDWSHFRASEVGRNILYIARDLSVNEIAFPHLRSDETRREVAFMLDQYGGNRDLPDLMRDAVIQIDPHQRDAALSATEADFAKAVQAAYEAGNSLDRTEKIAHAAQTIREIYGIEDSHEKALPQHERVR